MGAERGTSDERTPTRESIQSWLVNRIAESIGANPAEIDVTVSFAYYGLDSVAAFGMSGELENWLGRKLPPTLTWDYPSIELLAAFLAGG